MTEDGETAPSTRRMRQSLQFMYDLWTQQTMPMEIMEKGHAPMDMFAPDRSLCWSDVRLRGPHLDRISRDGRPVGVCRAGSRPRQSLFVQRHPLLGRAARHSLDECVHIEFSTATKTYEITEHRRVSPHKR